MQEHYQPPPNGFRTFSILWVTQSFSVIGSALTFFSVTVWLTTTLYPNPEQKAQLALALSVISLAWGIPNIFLGPLGGAWADRYDRKRIMIIMDALNCFMSILLAVLIQANRLQLGLLAFLASIASTCSTIHYAAYEPSYAMLVPEKQLPRANGMMQTVWSLSNVISPGLAAALIALPALARQGAIRGMLGDLLVKITSGASLAIGLDAFTFLVAAIVPLFLFVPSPHTFKKTDPQIANKPILADVKEGALYIWRRTPLMWLLGTYTIANLVLSCLVLMPMLVKYNLAFDWQARGYTLETALALITSVGGIGGVIGGILVSTWGGLKKRRVFGVVAPLVVCGFLLVTAGLSPWLLISAAAMALFEGLIPVMNTHSQTIWQVQTPREIQGCVFAVRRLIGQFASPMGTALVGWLGGITGAGTIFAVSGGLLAAFCLAQLFNTQLLHVEDKAYLDALASSKTGGTK